MAAAILNSSSPNPDQQLIKKAYKLIPRLATTETGSAALQERSGELQALMLATTDTTPASGRRDRMLAITEIINHLPTSDLHFIPAILSEVVLGCKESNEKARTAAFDLLILLAKRTTDSERNPPGTVIRRSLVPGVADDSPDAPATLEEFFTMVSAGLAGSAPHMVGATVTALSRLFFDFQTQLQPEMLKELVETVELFLTSNNREIVRSVLGFVKVAVVVLPDETLRPRLSTMVPSLMAWNKEHKGRLRSKVKGIIDRLVRRFGAPLLEAIVGEEDRKLIVNIRKARERSKRKKKEGAEGEDEDEEEKATPSTKPFTALTLTLPTTQTTATATLTSMTWLKSRVATPRKKQAKAPSISARCPPKTIPSICSAPTLWPASPPPSPASASLTRDPARRRSSAPPRSTLTAVLSSAMMGMSSLMTSKCLVLVTAALTPTSLLLVDPTPSVVAREAR
jgi:hypothetical protein